MFDCTLVHLAPLRLMQLNEMQQVCARICMGLHVLLQSACLADSVPSCQTRMFSFPMHSSVPRLVLTLELPGSWLAVKCTSVPKVTLSPDGFPYAKPDWYAKGDVGLGSIKQRHYYLAYLAYLA